MKITLAGKDYELPERFLLGQIRRISEKIGALLKPEDDPSGNLSRIWDCRLSVITIALSPQWPDISPDVLEGMPITNDEVAAAYEAIVEHAGFVRKGQALGEGTAETAA